MSVEILNAVIHGVKKAQNTLVAVPKFKTGCFPTDDEILVSFTDELLTSYSEEANTWADIKKPEDNIYHQHLIKWFNPLSEESMDFYTFSKNVVGLIVEQIKERFKATGGYVLFIHYKSQNKNFLLIAMLKLETTFGINDDDLAFYSSESFTMKNFHEAVRMNLDTWFDNSINPVLNSDGEIERCFVFVKKRGVDEDITKYFRLALGCENFAESRTNTTNLINALDEYIDTLSFESNEKKQDFREQKRDQLHIYLAEKIQSKQPASLKAITSLISPTDDDTVENGFLEFIRSSEKYKIDETFNPNKAKVRELEKVSGKIKGGSVSFQISEIDQSVTYNKESRELTFKDIPEALHQKIVNAKGA